MSRAPQRIRLLVSLAPGIAERLFDRGQPARLKARRIRSHTSRPWRARGTPPRSSTTGNSGADERASPQVVLRRIAEQPAEARLEVRKHASGNGGITLTPQAVGRLTQHLVFQGALRHRAELLDLLLHHRCRYFSSDS